jgi:outer membrane immunogenic protein
MRRVSLALLASAAMAFGFNQTVSAAELPVRAAPVAAAQAPAPVATWSGFYICVNGGAAWQSSPSWSLSDASGSRFSSLNIPGNSSAALGAVGGLQIGYLWWVAPIWVFGVEGDFDWASLADQRSGTLLDRTGALVPASTLQMSANTQWLASARGRLGIVGWNTLWYVTGGGAWVNTEYTATATAGQFGAGLAAPLSNTSFNTTKAGWVLGGGAEWHATTNILLRAEYLYYHVNNAAAGSAAFVPSAISVAAAAGPTMNYGWSSYNVQVGRIAVSYLF